MLLRIIHPVLICIGLFIFTPAIADEIRVAVASNFSGTLLTLANQFETKTPHKVIIISGSSGKHYAQIKNGAPFDAFFSADTERPQKLEAEGSALANSRFTYAIGKLVLWSPKKNFVDASGSVLTQDTFQHLAIANPKLAPYGLAAQQALQQLGLWDKLATRLVRGENIDQTLHFVTSGNAELGFVAYSQIVNLNPSQSGSHWLVPAKFYSPIEQQAVLLKDNATAKAFLEFVRSDEAKKMIRESGYDTP